MKTLPYPPYEYEFTRSNGLKINMVTEDRVKFHPQSLGFILKRLPNSLSMVEETTRR